MAMWSRRFRERVKAEMDIVDRQASVYNMQAFLKSGGSKAGEPQCTEKWGGPSLGA